MATGDLKGSIRKIEQGLRLINYPRDVDYTVLVKGDPAAFLPIISYSFTSFSTYIAELLVKCDVELTAKSDLRFIEAIYKLLRDQFQYKPILTKQQFLQFGFVERKMQIVCDIINCVVKKHKELSNSNKKPLVERHSGNEISGDLHPLPLPAQGGNEEELCLDHDVVKVNCEQRTHSCPYFQIIEDNSQIEALKSQLADCQEKLRKLDCMEDKLHVLEEKLEGKVIIDEKDWNNLLGRVLLLETELLLQSKKRELLTELSNVSQEGSSGRIPGSPAYLIADLAIREQKAKVTQNRFCIGTERKEEMPECLHQLSGYSSLLSTDPSPKAVTIKSHDLTGISKETTRQRMERISKIIEETSELLKTSNNTSGKT
ncbi:centrosomal protein of 44 kDa isoform X6 [Neopsephotus bourkii]|uniref:centrosomal protein of 44 kDa isoform X6 n=1 Tax=Neopsephotus bourkii TaxID=309878 RepID=UPI002AA521D9|nr:centrosomal protein of 44 kDa isoform X6 [Neopsephotus bourkii]